MKAIVLESGQRLSFRSRLCGLCCSSRGANSERFPCESGRSMENGRKRELEKLTMAIREIKKKTKSERASMAGSAEPRKSAGHWSWPFEVRAALCVWVVTLNMRAAIEFVNDWKRRRKNVTAWSQDQIREEAVSFDRLDQKSLGETSDEERQAGTRRSWEISKREAVVRLGERTE